MTCSEFEIERTAPIPSLEASVFNTIVSLLFGNDDIGEETKCFLSVKCLFAGPIPREWYVVFLVSQVHISEYATVAKSGIKFLK